MGGGVGLILSLFIFIFYQSSIWSHCVCLSCCPCVQFCPDDISWTTQLFSMKLVWWFIIMRQSIMHQKIVLYLQDQGHCKGFYDKNMTVSTISPKLLVCLQPSLVWWYNIISWSVLWRKSDYCFQGQDHSEGSKCHWMFIWMTSSEPQKHFVNKLGMVMQHHEPECLAEEFLLFARSWSQQGLISSQYDSFCCILWAADSFATKRDLRDREQPNVIWERERF